MEQMSKNESPYHSYTQNKILMSKMAIGGISFKREKRKKAEAGKEIAKARSKVIFEAG